MIRQLKNALARVVNSHPYFWFVAWRLIRHLPFLLPHEKSYYAFRHLAQEREGLFLDVGANDGLSALGFRKLVPHYRVHSIEANRLHEPSLRRLKAKLERFDYLITAAGDRTSEFTLHTAVYRGMVLHTGASLNLDYLRGALARAFPKRVVDHVTYDRQVVPVIKLDDLNLNPDIIKTDAEGFDYEVLVGLKGTILRNRPFILIEYSEPMTKELQALCKEISYDLLAYDERVDRFEAFDAAREKRKHLTDRSPVNLFLVPQEKISALPMGSAS